MPECNPGLAQIIRRHLDVDLIAHADANKVLAHLPGDVCQDFVTVWQRHAKHGAGQDLSHCSGQLDWFFFSHWAMFGLVQTYRCQEAIQESIRKNQKNNVNFDLEIFSLPIILRGR